MPEDCEERVHGKHYSIYVKEKDHYIFSITIETN